MIRLYEYAPSGNCYKVRLALSLLKIPFERVECVLKDDHLLDKSPYGVAPFVEFDDGRVLGESNAILWHFAEGTRLVPSDRWLRAQALQWLFFEQYNHEPNIATARFWIRYAGLAEAKKAELVGKHERGYAALERMESHLAKQPYFVGGEYSIADIALYAYTHVADEGGFDLGRYPSIRQWMERVASQPGHVLL